jgi:hypothetical protein
MGCVSSQPQTAEGLQSKNIDVILNEAKNEAMLDFKVLLLGNPDHVIVILHTDMLQARVNLVNLPW